MKFTSPLDGELWITQNYHQNSSNRAIDISAVQDRPVKAIANGKITTATPSGNSYCVQSVDGSDIKIFYVHTYKWLPVGSQVKQGDIICYIAPKSLNGGFPTHLHLGTDLNHNIMDYMDRSIIFRTGYTDIRTDWFNGVDLNWSLFSNLQYGTQTPPEVLEMQKLQEQVNTLQSKLDELTGQLVASQGQVKVMSKTIDEQDTKIENLEQTNKALMEEVNTAVEKSKFYEKQYIDTSTELNELKRKGLLGQILDAIWKLFKKE